MKFWRSKEATAQQSRLAPGTEGPQKPPRFCLPPRRALALRGSMMLLLALVSLPLVAQKVSTGDPMHVRLREIGEKLKCQCEGPGGCAYTVGSCNMLHCPFREEVYTQMRQYLQAGMGDAAIIDKLKDKYGVLILASPPAKGFNLLGWLMPFLTLLMGLIVIRYVLLRWRRPKPAAATAGAGALVEKYREQMEKELSDLE
jgi:cytochrome c-type biogenesis protein CcmH/NrfF